MGSGHSPGSRGLCKPAQLLERVRVPLRPSPLPEPRNAVLSGLALLHELLEERKLLDVRRRRMGLEVIGCRLVRGEVLADFALAEPEMIAEPVVGFSIDGPE